MAPPFFLSGSRSSQFDRHSSVDNPLPPCPGSPNCVRLTRHMEISQDEALAICRKVLDSMNAAEIRVKKEGYRLHSVFTPFIFKDDLIILLEQAGPVSCYLHMRSASRIGRSDLGVNRRRIKRFLKRFREELN